MIKINLLALTGFGNEALKTLLKYKDKVSVVAIYTRAEKGEFPYYAEENIARLAQRHGIKTFIVPSRGDWSIYEKVNLNLVVTFHRILRVKHLKMARYNINIHPSLLPSYRGPTPTNWMVHNKEKLCGLSAHILTDEVDNGPIIFQKAYALTAKTDYRLRRFLAKRVGAIINAIVKDFPDYCKVKSAFKESCYTSFYKAKVIKNERELYAK